MNSETAIGLQVLERHDLPDRSPTMPQDWLVIINPRAGHQHAHGWLMALSRRLQRELDVEVVITQSYDQITDLLGATSAANGVAVFGGDGTIAEVVNHMQLSRQSLLLLPGGTGNGLARDLGMTSIDRALAAYRANTQRDIDLLQVTLHTQHEQFRRLTISTSSLGYAAETVVRAKQLSRALGPFRYTIASILQAARTPSCQLTVEIDGTIRDIQLTNLMVNNTRHAGNFSVFRNASLSDGQSDILLAKNSFWQQVLYNLGLLTHTYIYPRGHELSAKTMHVRSALPLRLMLDGEIWEDVHEMTVSVLPQQLRCYYWPTRHSS